MDEDIPQLYELIQDSIRTPERARQLIHLISEVWRTNDPVSLVYVHDGPHKSEWTVSITRAGNLPINIIKELRDRYRTLMLKECADSLFALRDHGTPWVVRSHIGFEEAHVLKGALEKLGATVSVY